MVSRPFTKKRNGDWVPRYVQITVYAILRNYNWCTFPPGVKEGNRTDVCPPSYRQNQTFYQEKEMVTGYKDTYRLLCTLSLGTTIGVRPPLGSKKVTGQTYAHLPIARTRPFTKKRNGDWAQGYATVCIPSREDEQMYARPLITHYSFNRKERGAKYMCLT